MPILTKVCTDYLKGAPQPAAVLRSNGFRVSEGGAFKSEPSSVPRSRRVRILPDLGDTPSIWNDNKLCTLTIERISRTRGDELYRLAQVSLLTEGFKQDIVERTLGDELYFTKDDVRFQLLGVFNNGGWLTITAERV